jgi:hypothetical protein
MKAVSPKQTIQIKVTAEVVTYLDNKSEEMSKATLSEKRGETVSRIIAGAAGHQDLRSRLERSIQTLQGTTDSLLKATAENKRLEASNESLRSTILSANESIKSASSVAESRNSVIKSYQSTLDSMMNVMRELTQ